MLVLVLLVSVLAERTVLRGAKGVPRKGFEHRSTWGFEHAKNSE